MGIQPKFSPDDVKKMIKVKTDRIDHVIISRLKYIGETFVNNARSNNTYLDQTGNLRSSIGYIVLKNGKKQYENYQLSERGTEKQKGMSTGKQLANELASGLSIGYVLIVVAGMDYAASVESKGKDVLTASSILAKEQLITAMDKIKNSLR